jgi:hypothetical protein
MYEQVSNFYKTINKIYLFTLYELGVAASTYLISFNSNMIILSHISIKQYILCTIIKTNVRMQDQNNSILISVEIKINVFNDRYL